MQRGDRNDHPPIYENFTFIGLKVTDWPMNGGTTMRFMRPRALTPPTVQLGNSGIDPPAQIPQRDVIDATMAFFGTGCILNEQVILQDQEGVLAWVSERLAA